MEWYENKNTNSSVLSSHSVTNFFYAIGIFIHDAWGGPAAGGRFILVLSCFIIVLS